MNNRDAEALRRIASIQRHFKEFLTSTNWVPHSPVLMDGVSCPLSITLKSKVFFFLFEGICQPMEFIESTAMDNRQ